LVHNPEKGTSSTVEPEKETFLSLERGSNKNSWQVKLK